MDFLPKDLEDIIIDYKEHFEHQELVKEHIKYFYKSLCIIKNLRNRSHGAVKIGKKLTSKIVTIGPLLHSSGYIFCHCFKMCLICNEYIHSSRQDVDDSCCCEC